ncbi:hypothetical protein BEL04_05370 [Mucilaginibacter sp. PPCGB 2223]|uniref:sensor histidine kinase n=1 Tax=Mucilaginibacter sp. PPCGB 2223 TaxID=1886027 RepID=UPI0008253775|nr:histidine kinase [Mucilaginibacter sp. PPCGB 2223]OCX53722.1 hypothetical protein BEL04_05370 [Mucilaginibacter sp. PPCGB 2223]
MVTIQEFISNKWKRHLLFCLAIVVIFGLGVFLLHAGRFPLTMSSRVFNNCCFFVLYVYAGRWLCTRYYIRGRLTAFSLYCVTTLFGLLFADLLLTRYMLGFPNADFLEMMYGYLTFFACGMIAGILLKLISFSMQKELSEARAKAEQKESELGLLQAQLSPHFLFNVLNNLYGISIAEHERVPPLLLKLSALLRYSVYGAKKIWVPLKDELEYLENFITFEQIRISDRLTLQKELPVVSDPNIQIAPMVLIIFVENAFKHAKGTTERQIYITISLKLTDRLIILEVSNSFQHQVPPNELEDEDSGLGLTNTTRRLNLLYGDDHRLTQYSQDDRYYVKLQIPVIYG